MSGISAEQLLEKVVSLAQEKKAYDLISLKLTGLTLIADYFVLMTAEHAI